MTIAILLYIMNIIHKLEPKCESFENGTRMTGLLLYDESGRQSILSIKILRNQTARILYNFTVIIFLMIYAYLRQL